VQHKTVFSMEHAWRRHLTAAVSMWRTFRILVAIWFLLEEDVRATADEREEVAMAGEWSGG
jgi:hypothetical protein